MKKLARTLMLPLAVCAAITSTACDKAKSGGGGGGGASGVSGAAAIAPTGGLKRALAAMPKDTDILLGADLSQVRSSGLYKKYEPMLKQKIGNKLDEFKAMCGFDPVEKISGVLVGAKMNDSRDATMFIRGFEKGPVMDCLKKASADPSKGKLTVDGDYVEFVPADEPEPKRFLFVDDKTILVITSGGQMADKAALTAAAGAKDGDGLSGLAGRLDSVKTGSAVWFVMNGSAGPMSQMPFKLNDVVGWVNVASGVDGEMRLRMKSKDEATTIVTMGNSQLDQVKNTPYAEFVKHVKLSANGSDAVISFKLDDKQFDTLVTQMTSLAGGGGF